MAEIREPEVEKVPIPQSEPLCRVGLCLEEDGKTAMTMKLSAGKYRFTTGATSLEIASDGVREITVSVRGNTLALNEGGKPIPVENADSVRVDPPSETCVLHPGDGITLRGVVAGRGFHWQKEVDLVFPGRLEFFCVDGRLVVVNVLPMEIYLACVVTSEMSAACPPEFIKAQATAARSWMLVFLKNKHIGRPYTICNDDCCQRYQGSTFLSEEVARAVTDCSGMCLMTKDDFVCGAYYSKSCGGIMEQAENIFGRSAVGLSASPDAPEGTPTAAFNPVNEGNIREWLTGPIAASADSFCSPSVCHEETLPRYLGAVDEAGRYFRWKVVYTQEELTGYLKTKAGIQDIAEFLDFRSLWRGNSGRIHELEVRYRTPGGQEKAYVISTQYAIRNALHVKFLFSSAFVWDYEKDAAGRVAKVILQGGGWGHGVGFCQIGALGMSLKGYTYDKILKHYFGGTHLVKAY
ncbi:MAG TPA: SpoIID/LytB domain-containing protein [Candidatus Sumerlaeota bacterium]|nr:SpoIID/LytB domain-containing protein [Candidatus Sumerlaeota bacterium]